MGFRFHKRINLFGGAFRINFSKSGIGYSYGGKGARVTKMANGRTRTTLSIPGSGISYVTESGSKRKKRTRHVKGNYNKTQETSEACFIGFLTLLLFIFILITFGVIPAIVSLFVCIFLIYQKYK